tara:strand:- start:764 stop:877 length:114 start_codon:yes stop_codon:yes gene_type:complete
MMRYAATPAKTAMNAELRVDDAAPVNVAGVAVANGTL